MVRVAGALALLCLASGSYYALSPARTPRGQLSLTNLDSKGFAAFEQMFDDSADRVRIVGLFSPTCSTCLRGASALQTLLREFDGAPLTVLVVWEPILVTDSIGVKVGALARIPDKRAIQFWDKSHQVSTHMGGPASFGPKSGAKFFFEMDEHLWDLVAVYAPGFRWKDSGASPAFAGAPVVKVIDDVRAQLAAALVPQKVE